MQMTFRWFGDTKDTVSLEQIRQIPGVVGVVPALHTLPCGEPWPLDKILDMKREIENAGLTMECIESVNVHEDIKLGRQIHRELHHLHPQPVAGRREGDLL